MYYSLLNTAAAKFYKLFTYLDTFLVILNTSINLYVIFYTCFL